MSSPCDSFRIRPGTGSDDDPDPGDVCDRCDCYRDAHPLDPLYDRDRYQEAPAMPEPDHPSSSIVRSHRHSRALTGDDPVVHDHPGGDEIHDHGDGRVGYAYDELHTPAPDCQHEEVRLVSAPLGPIHQWWACRECETRFVPSTNMEAFTAEIRDAVAAALRPLLSQFVVGELGAFDDSAPAVAHRHSSIAVSDFKMAVEHTHAGGGRHHLHDDGLDYWEPGPGPVEHEHRWGAWIGETASGTVLRRCQVDGCDEREIAVHDDAADESDEPAL